MSRPGKYPVTSMNFGHRHSAAPDRANWSVPRGGGEGEAGSKGGCRYTALVNHARVIEPRADGIVGLARYMTAADIMLGS